MKIIKTGDKIRKECEKKSRNHILRSVCPRCESLLEFMWEDIHFEDAKFFKLFFDRNFFVNCLQCGEKITILHEENLDYETRNFLYYFNKNIDENKKSS